MASFDVLKFAAEHSGSKAPKTKPLETPTAPTTGTSSEGTVASASAKSAPAQDAASATDRPKRKSGSQRRKQKKTSSREGQVDDEGKAKTPAKAESKSSEEPKTQTKVKAKDADEGGLSEPKKKDLPLRTLAREWAKGYRIPAPSHLIEKWTAKTHFNFCAIEEGVLGENQHGLLAAYRQAATVFSLVTLLERGHKVIDILFYSQRDIAITENLKNFMKKRSTEELQFNLIGDSVTVGDTIKRFDTGHLATGTACLVVDVYHDNVLSATKPMDALTFERYGYEDAIWVGHIFPGRFGAVDTSCWMRDDDDMITWYADSVNLAYPKHPACDAMVTPMANGRVSSTVLHTYALGESVVFRLMLITKSTLKCAAAQADQVKSLWLQTEIADYSQMPAAYRLLPGWARKMIPVGNIRLWVKTTHVSTLKAELASKGRSHWTFANFQQTVKRVLDEDVEFMQIERAFPQELSAYRHVLACVIFAHEAKLEADILTATGDAAGEHLNQYEVARRSIATPTDPAELSKLVSVAGWGLAIVLLFAIARYLKSRPANTGVMEATWRAMRDVHLRQYNNQSYAPPGQIAWASILQAWSNRPGPANAKLLTRVSRLLQSMKDRANNMLPHRQLANACHSAIDKAANMVETGTIHAGALATTAVGIASTPLGATPSSQLGYISEVLAAPLIEEGFKHMIPHWFWKVTTSSACAFLDMFQYQNPNLGLLAWHAAFHNTMAFLPLKYAVMIHTAYNTVARPCGFGSMSTGVAGLTLGLAALQFGNSGLLAEFDDHHYHSEKEPGRFVPIEKPIIEDVGVAQCWVPALDCRPTQVPILDPRVHMTKLPEMVHMKKNETDGYYRAIYHNAPMFKPAKSHFNMICVALYRLRKAVEIPVPEMWDLSYRAFSRMPYQIGAPILTTKLPKHEYACLADVFRDYYRLAVLPLAPRCPTLAELHDVDEGYTAQEVFDHWCLHTEKSKRDRYEAAFLQNSTNPITPADKRVQQMQVNIKTDEVLLKVGSKTQNGFIPRPIHAVDPTVVVTTGPWIYRATGDLKGVLNDAPVGSMNGYKIYLKFAAGATDKQLSEWVNEFREHIGPAVLIMVGGDDSLVGIKLPNGKIIWLTGDLTACDRSIGPEALKAEWQVLADLRTPREVIELMIVNAGATLRCAVNDRNSEAVFLTRPLERNTGGVDTTFGNTVCVLIAWHMIILEMIESLEILNPEVGAIQRRFRRFGLTVKMRANWAEEYGFAPEFLKGWWLPVHHFMGARLVWTPLPSRLLKITKTIKDPRLTYKKWGVTDMTTGLQCHLASVAKGLAPFAQPTPLREVFDAWEDMAPTSVPIEALDEDWYVGKTRADYSVAPTVIVDEFYKAVQNRYHITPGMMTEFLTILKTIKVGQLFFHPVWEGLAADYA